MSVAYKIFYQLGVTPWEQMASGPVAEQISGLFDREEAGRRPPYGQVLDLGCGTGIWSVLLAARGWQVTGVDNVPKALRSARERAWAADVEVRFVEGDVTALRAGFGAGFRFFVDFGCFHDELKDAQRAAVGREVSALAAADATLLMMAWAPGRRGPLLPRGASRPDIAAALPEWMVVDETAMDTSGAPGPVRKACPRFYRLRRR